MYVYEGIEPEAPRSKRNKMVNPRYFSGDYDGADNAKLWNEVYAYLDSGKNPFNKPKGSQGMPRRRTCESRPVRAYEFPPDGMEPDRSR